MISATQGKQLDLEDFTQKWVKPDENQLQCQVLITQRMTVKVTILPK